MLLAEDQDQTRVVRGGFSEPAAVELRGEDPPVPVLLDLLSLRLLLLYLLLFLRSVLTFCVLFGTLLQCPYHYRDACAACHGLYEELVGPVAAFACL